MQLATRCLWLLPLLLAGCSPPAPSTSLTETAIYHWRTQLRPDSSTWVWQQRLGATRWYVRFFDVDWDEASSQPLPLATVEIDPGHWPPQPPVVPTVFVTNRTLEKIPPPQLPELAKNLAAKLASLADGYPYTEVQLDCDWTATTRQAYFELLQQLRRQLPPGVQLSATIRLHQYRHPDQTGVPPVDRGMLMYYNMGELDAWEEPNSILNLDAAAPYLNTPTPYPLALDLALPLFRWGVLFRDQQMIKLINELAPDELADSLRFIPLGSGRYVVRQSTYLRGYYLYAGDRIKLEAASPALLHAALAQLAGKLPAAERRYVAFYHLDSNLVAGFSADSLRRWVDNWAAAR